MRKPNEGPEEKEFTCIGCYRKFTALVGGERGKRKKIDRCPQCQEVRGQAKRKLYNCGRWGLGDIPEGPWKVVRDPEGLWGRGSTLTLLEIMQLINDKSLEQGIEFENVNAAGQVVSYLGGDSLVPVSA